MIEDKVRIRMKTLKNARYESLVSMDYAIKQDFPLWEIREFSKLHDDLCNEYLNLLSSEPDYYVGGSAGW